MAAIASQVEPIPQDRLLELLAKRSLRKGKPFRLSSGKTSDYLFDIKTTILDPEGANLIADAIVDRLATRHVEAIGGLVLGAVPIVAAVCQKSFRSSKPIPAFFVRKEPKGHGTDQLIDGNIKPGMHVILVDDVTTTGGSVLKAVHAVRQAGCTVDEAITVVDREEGAAENLQREGISLVPLYTRSDFES